MTSKQEYPVVYGPVPSRRLGYSLGVDIIPYKTCSLDCVYCQLGPTPHKTLNRKSLGSAARINQLVKRILDSGKKIDVITFSGSGEPTLNRRIGRMIRGLKRNFRIPVAVLTNSTLFTRRGVRKSLRKADLVVPSLDAATQEVFQRINRPHPGLQIQDIIQGLKTFRREFSGKIWLEVMLVKGFNDSKDHLHELKKAIQLIKPDRVQLNTVVRPPAVPTATPLSQQELEQIQRFLDGKCQIIPDFDIKDQTRRSESIQNDIMTMVRRRPVTLDDLERSLGRHKNELLKHIDALIREERIKPVPHGGKNFYEPGPTKPQRKEQA